MYFMEAALGQYAQVTYTPVFGFSRIQFLFTYEPELPHSEVGSGYGSCLKRITKVSQMAPFSIKIN